MCENVSHDWLKCENFFHSGLFFNDNKDLFNL
jgi:hypothetical protein